MAKNTHANRYTRLIEAIFLKHYQLGATAIAFERDEINQTAEELGMVLPKNLGDVLYSFRYRTQLPSSILEKAPEGYEWIIQPPAGWWGPFCACQAVDNHTILRYWWRPGCQIQHPGSSPSMSSVDKQALTRESATIALSISSRESPATRFKIICEPQFAV